MSAWFGIAYVTCFSFNPACFLLSSTLLAKIAKPRTRGSFFAINGLFGSFMIILAQSLGSLTSNYNSAYEFIGASAINGAALLGIIICAIMGKLKI